MVGWSGILARKMSRWFFEKREISGVFVSEGFWEEVKQPGTMNSKEPLPGLLHIGRGITWNAGRDSQPAPSVTPLPFHLKPTDKPLGELPNEADLVVLPPALLRVNSQFT